MLKARGTVKVTWRTYDTTTKALIATKDIDSSFAMQGEASVGSAMRAGIVANARLFFDTFLPLDDRAAKPSA